MSPYPERLSLPPWSSSGIVSTVHNHPSANHHRGTHQGDPHPQPTQRDRLGGAVLSAVGSSRRWRRWRRRRGLGTATGAEANLFPKIRPAPHAEDHDGQHPVGPSRPIGDKVTNGTLPSSAHDLQPWIGPRPSREGVRIEQQSASPPLSAPPGHLPRPQGREREDKPGSKHPANSLAPAS